MFIHVLVFENNSQIGSSMLKLRLSHRADYIVYFQAHSSKWFISGETAIICENQFVCWKCAMINNSTVYSKGQRRLRGKWSASEERLPNWNCLQLQQFLTMYDEHYIVRKEFLLGWSCTWRSTGQCWGQVCGRALPPPCSQQASWPPPRSLSGINHHSGPMTF